MGNFCTRDNETRRTTRRATLRARNIPGTKTSRNTVVPISQTSEFAAFPVEQDFTKLPDFFSFRNYRCKAYCSKVYDGDSVHLVIPYQGLSTRIRVRLNGIDTAELRSKDPLEKNVAQRTKTYLASLILEKYLYVHLYDFDKYGRVLATLFLSEDAAQRNESLNEHLVQKGYAYRYSGKKKPPFSEWYAEYAKLTFNTGDTTKNDNSENSTSPSEPS